VKERGKMKFYGAGIASSVSEIENFKSNQNYIKLDLNQSFPEEEVLV